MEGLLRRYGSGVDEIFEAIDRQPALDAIIAEFDAGRAFVRPSGTEDVVRVYAEASTQDEADQLALLTAQATWKLAGGTGATSESY